MLLNRLQEVHSQVGDLEAKRLAHQNLLEEQKDNLSDDQRAQVQSILDAWKQEQEDLAIEIALLIPNTASEVSGLLREHIAVHGDQDQLHALLASDKAPFSKALSDNLIEHKFDMGTTDKEGEKAMEIADALSAIIELEQRYPELGSAVVATLGKVEKVLNNVEIAKEDTVEEQAAIEPSSPSMSAMNALALINSDKETALSIINSSSAKLAGDLIELKETQPEKVMSFLRSLHPDARREIFEAGLPLEQTSSLFLFDISEVAGQIRKLFKNDTSGSKNLVNALSTLAMLVEESDEALQSNDSERLGHILGVFSALGYKRAMKIAEFDYMHKKFRSGDVHHAEHNKEVVISFLHAYEDQINSLHLEIEDADLTQSMEVKKGSETPGTVDRVKLLAERTAAIAIQEAKSAFQEVDIDE